MNIIKMIGCILVISSSSAIGYHFSSGYNKRIEDLKEFRRTILMLRGDIKHTSTPLPEAIYSLSNRNKGIFANFFINLSNMLNEYHGNTFAAIWDRAVKESFKITSLTTKDIEAVIAFGENLGYLDKDMQLSCIDLYIEHLDLEIEEAMSSIKQKTYLFNSLGLMIGIFISIIML